MKLRKENRTWKPWRLAMYLVSNVLNSASGTVDFAVVGNQSCYANFPDLTFVETDLVARIRQFERDNGC